MTATTMREETGYIGSLLLHGTLIGLAVLVTTLAPHAPEQVSDQDPLLLEVWAGDGSERDPGIPGRERGIAEGVRSGDKQKTGLGARSFAPLKKMNAEKFLKEVKELEAKAAAEAAKAAQKTADSTKTTAKRESLEDFKKATGRVSSGKSSPQGAPGGVSATGSSKGKPGISGTAVGESGTGHVTGRDGFGRAGGRGKNGGDGGSGNADMLFAGEVRGAFADLYIPMFREQGGDMTAAHDRGVIKLRVSESGLVSFAGWSVQPSDAVVARVAEAAVNKMRPVRPPPGGESITLLIPVGGKLDD